MSERQVKNWIEYPCQSYDELTYLTAIDRLLIFQLRLIAVSILLTIVTAVILIYAYKETYTMAQPLENQITTRHCTNSDCGVSNYRIDFGHSIPKFSYDKDGKSFEGFFMEDEHNETEYCPVCQMPIVFDDAKLRNTSIAFGETYDVTASRSFYECSLRQPNKPDEPFYYYNKDGIQFTLYGSFNDLMADLCERDCESYVFDCEEALHEWVILNGVGKLPPNN